MAQGMRRFANCMLRANSGRMAPSRGLQEKSPWCARGERFLLNSGQSGNNQL
jgi:hypothetical protein